MFLLIGSMDHIEGICHKKDAVCDGKVAGKRGVKRGVLEWQEKWQSGYRILKP